MRILKQDEVVKVSGGIIYPDISKILGRVGSGFTKAVEIGGWSVPVGLAIFRVTQSVVTVGLPPIVYGLNDLSENS